MTARESGVAAKLVGVTWLVVAMFVGITLRYQVPNPVELLDDVAARPVPWLVANVALIVLPLVIAHGIIDTVAFVGYTLLKDKLNLP